MQMHANRGKFLHQQSKYGFVFSILGIRNKKLEFKIMMTEIAFRIIKARGSYSESNSEW